MAEFCLDCFNKLNDTDYTKKEVRLEEDFCEACASWKPCVMQLHPKTLGYRIADGIRKRLESRRKRKGE